MARARAVLILLIASALVFWVYLVKHYAGQPLAGPTGGADGVSGSPAATVPAGKVTLEMQPFFFTSNDDCEPCHEEIFDEWVDGQHALSWFNEPLLPQDPKRTECSNCHAPRPILEVGIDKLPVVRSERFHEGVGCLECHQNGDHVEGPRPGAEAPCNPRFNPAFGQSVICSSCHAPHGSLDEWKGSEWGRKGYTCQACHMPLVDAPSVTGQSPRRRRSHRMVSQRDPGVISRALELEAKLPGANKVEIALTNVGVGHNVPGEIFNRELFLKTEIYDPEGELKGEHRESFKTVRREQRASEPSTQLRPGERRSFAYELGTEHGKIKILVGYKLLLFLPDQAAMSVHEREVEF